MSLPKVVAPQYEVKLFSLPNPVTYRPYLVKEEKLLLMAQQSEDVAEQKRAVNQIINECTFGKIVGTALPSFDFEFLMLQLRARSVNNIIELNFECQNQVGVLNGTGTKKCGTIVPVSIDIDAVQLHVPEGHTNRIWLTDTVGVTMKYPTAELADAVQRQPDTQMLDVVVDCLETVFTSDGDVTECAEQTREDLVKFVDELSVTQAVKFRQFFDTMPELKHTFNFKCPKCGYEQEYTLKGFADFFV